MYGNEPDNDLESQYEDRYTYEKDIRAEDEEIRTNPNRYDRMHHSEELDISDDLDIQDDLDISDE